MAIRRRVLKLGRMEMVGGGAIDCVVRNISDTGAALDVISPIGIAERFSLIVEKRTRSCRVVWRKETRIGVEFVDSEKA